MVSIGKIINDLKKDRVIKNYERKDRYIEPQIYIELKKTKKCMRCKKRFSGRIPQIHHIIPHGKGGTNNKDNLMALCARCHEIMDKQQDS